MRISIRFRPRIAIRFAWIASVLLALGLGWGVGRYDLGEPSTARADEPAAAAPAEPEASGVDRRFSADSRLPGTAALPTESAPPAGPEAEREATGPALEGATAPMAAVREEPAEPPDPKPARPKSGKKVAEPVAEAAPEPAGQAVEVAEAAEPTEIEPPPPPGGGVLARARAADRLAEEDDADGAKREAAALLAEHASYTGLAAALVADGADEALAQLSALRVLQVAGEESTSREVARELRRSYSGTEEIAESIHRWGILNPRIQSAQPSIEEGRLVVNGTLENPDVVHVRRLKIEVEALDAGGNLLAMIEARVRPNVLPPGGAGSFQAIFKKLDPASVLRTRAILVEWESEVSDAPVPRREPVPRAATETAD